MKKFMSIIFAAVILSMNFTAFAADSDEAGEIQVYVNHNLLDISDLSKQLYYDDGMLMVPLRRVSEALGYTVSWDSETGAITVDDNYIQKAVLYNGTADAVFDDNLKVIDISRTVKNCAETVIYDGCTFVPADFFKEFFNDVVFSGNCIFISPSKCELH